MRLCVYFHHLKAFLSNIPKYLLVGVDDRSLQVAITHRYLRYRTYHYLYHLRSVMVPPAGNSLLTLSLLYRPNSPLPRVHVLGPVREETHRKTVIVPPVGLPLPGFISPDTMRLFESKPKLSCNPPGSSAGCPNFTTSIAPICRVCHEGDHMECLMSLCKCSGNIGLLHVSCLEHWLNTQNVDDCEVCNHRFPTVAQATGILSSSPRLCMLPLYGLCLETCCASLS
ncbi:hypothetical protein HPB51_026735 [Rhipicephalus microplus]|uniref:RING-CH-type domain-containing protein n=1 Tax=Rhipicephalus microplus TaxID=6941 RepID=A0A9J6D2A4_RHIMP|nr:hypothetical protein HPB51_026735 [Rhipicephalus microplus]